MPVSLNPTVTVKHYSPLREVPEDPTLLVAEKLIKALNSIRPKTPAATEPASQGLKPSLGALLAGVAVGGATSAVGFPIAGFALTYGSVSLIASMLGQYTSAQDTRTQNEKPARDAANAKLAAQVFEKVLGVFNSTQQDFLLDSLKGYEDRLNLPLLVNNLLVALDTARPGTSIETLLATLPVKQWVEAEEAAQDSRNKTLRQEERNSAILSFLNYLTPSVPRITAGLDPHRDHLAGATKAFSEVSRGKSEASAQRQAITTEKLSNWPAELAKASYEAKLDQLSIKFEAASQAYKAKTSAAPDFVQLGQTFRELKHELTVTKLQHDIYTTTDLETKKELRSKLSNIMERESHTVLMHENSERYYVKHDPDTAFRRDYHADKRRSSDIGASQPAAAPKADKPQGNTNAPAPAQSPGSQALQQVAIAGVGAGLGALVGQPVAGAVLAFAMSRPAKAATTPSWTAPLMPLTVVDTPPLTLNNHTQAADQALFKAFAEQWDRYKGDLEVTEQKQLLEAARKDLEIQVELGKRIEARDKTSKSILEKDLGKALTNEFKQPIDPHKVYFKTYYEQAKHDPSQIHEVSLYDATRRNFDWRESNRDPAAITDGNTDIVDASGKKLRISVSAMQTAIRAFDLGGRRAEQFKEVQVKELTQQAGSAQWESACLDFKRRTGNLTPALKGALNSTRWKSFALGLDGSAEHQSADTKLALPLMLIDSEGVTYSYFPGRPGGALQAHASEQAAITDFNEKIITDGKAGTLGWLYRGMSFGDQIKLDTFLKTKESVAKANEVSISDDTYTQLFVHYIRNPLANFLQEKLGSAPIPKAERLRVIADTPGGNKRVSMQAAISTKVTQRLESDWNFGLRTTGEANLQGVEAFVSDAAKQMMELFQLPLSGVGLNWLLTAVFGASLGVTITEAIVGLTKGDNTDAVQAGADVIDLLANGAMQGAAIRLGDRRAKNIIDNMQKPEAGLDHKVLTVIIAKQQLSSYVTDQIVPLTGEPDQHGVYHQDKRALVQIKHEDTLKTAEVKYDPQISAYRLSNGPENAYQPPVRYDESLKHCVVDTSLDTRDYSDVELLKWMLPISDASTPLSAEALKQVLDQTGTTRADLIARWKGQAIDEAHILDAVADRQLKNDIASASKTADTRDAVPTVGEERVILPVLAEKAGLALNIRNPDGSLYASYTPEGQLASQDAIDLIRDNAGEYRPTVGSHATDLPNADSLWRETLKAHEKITGHSQLGHNYQDNSFNGRLAELKSQVGARIAADQHILHAALGSQKVRDDLPLVSPARHYAPTAAAHLQASANVNTLRRFYPELSLNTARILLERHGPIDISKRSSRESLPDPLKRACDAQTGAIHMDTALASLASPTVQPVNLNAEALLCIAITGHKNANFRIRITDDQGGSGATYGNTRHSDVVNIIRYQDGKYAAARDGNEIGPYADSNPLISSMLRAMTATQRDALGVKENSAQRVADWSVAFYKNPQRRGAGSNALLEQRTPQLSQEEVRSYKAKNIQLAGLRPDARGVYVHPNGKSYIAIGNSPIQIKADSLYMRNREPLIRMVKPGTQHAALPGETYNPAWGNGLAVTHVVKDQWAIARVGLLGGVNVRRDANKILQGVYSASHDDVQAILDQYDFPNAASSMHTEYEFAHHLQRTLAVPDWAEQYRRPPVPDGYHRMPDGNLVELRDLFPLLPVPVYQPAIPNAIDIDLPIDPPQNSPVASPGGPVDSPGGGIRMDDEANLVRENTHAQNLILPQGTYLNSRGCIERKGAAGEYLYRAIDEDAYERGGDPSTWGFEKSINFGAVPKMLDGDAVITSATEEGARIFASDQYGNDFRIFKINAQGLSMVSLRENVASNPDFMDERQHEAPGTIARLTAQNQLMTYAERAYLLDEVHIEDSVGSDRIEEIRMI